MYYKKITQNVVFLLFVFFLLYICRFSKLVVICIAPLAIIGFLLLNAKKTDTKNKKNKDVPVLTNEKQQHYKEAGMGDKEINFFRETMATAKTQISQLEKNMNSVPKLKAINLRNNTLIAAKGIFKELVDEPQKLHRANHFLYTHLPNILELTNKYIEINNHAVKNKNTYDALAKSADVIDEMSILITDDYAKLVADDLEDMDVEISIAKQSISRDNEANEFKEKDSE